MEWQALLLEAAVVRRVGLFKQFFRWQQGDDNTDSHGPSAIQPDC